jgi:hypothetical protein
MQGPMKSRTGRINRLVSITPEQIGAYDAAVASFPENHVPSDHVASGRAFVRLAIRLGDWQILARLARMGLCLPHDFVADVLAGKEKRSENRPGSIGTKVHHAMMAACVKARQDSGVKKSDAVDQVAELFNVDRRTVQRAWKNEGPSTNSVGVFGPICPERAYLTPKDLAKKLRASDDVIVWEESGATAQLTEDEIDLIIMALNAHSSRTASDNK